MTEIQVLAPNRHAREIRINYTVYCISNPVKDELTRASYRRASITEQNAVCVENLQALPTRQFCVFKGRFTPSKLERSDHFLKFKI